MTEQLTNNNSSFPNHTDPYSFPGDIKAGFRTQTHKFGFRRAEVQETLSSDSDDQLNLKTTFLDDKIKPQE